MRVASVLLAAGAGSRFQGAHHKLLTPLGGKTIVEHSFAAMAEGTPIGSPLLVVRGAVGLPDLGNATIVDNTRWAEGQSSSVHAALDAARELGCQAVVVGLGDQPGISAPDWAALHRAMVDGAQIAVAVYGDRRGNPVGLAEKVWELLPTDADEGARSVMRRHPALVTEVACSGTPNDIDTIEDLQRWHLS